MWARIFIFSSLFLPLYGSIVSLDLCSDQWVLGLSNPSEIHFISPLAQDPHLSYLSAKAHGIPTHKGSAEEFIDPKIRTMVGYEPISPMIKRLCRKRGIKLIALSYPTSFKELKKQIMVLTQLFHKTHSVSQNWIHGLNQPSPPTKRKAVFYGAQGHCPCKGTLLGDVLNRAGYKNLYESKKGWAYNTLESLVDDSLGALFFLGPIPSHGLWQFFKKKNIKMKMVPYRLTLCPYPPAIIELIGFVKGTHS